MGGWLDKTKVILNSTQFKFKLVEVGVELGKIAQFKMKVSAKYFFLLSAGLPPIQLVRYNLISSLWAAS